MRVHDDEMGGIDAWARPSRRTTISLPKASYIIYVWSTRMRRKYLALYGNMRYTGYMATSSRDSAIHLMGPRRIRALGQDSVGWQVPSAPSHGYSCSCDYSYRTCKTKAGVAHDYMAMLSHRSMAIPAGPVVNDWKLEGERA